MARGGREDGGEGAGSGSGEQEQEVVHGRKEAGAGGGQDAGAEGRREKEVQHEKEWETEREREEEARLYRRAAAITGESAASIGILSYFLFHRCAAITGESAAIGRCRCFVPLSLDVLLAALFLSFSLPYPDPPSLRRTPFVCQLVSTCSPSLTHARTRAHTHTLSLTHTLTHTHNAERIALQLEEVVWTKFGALRLPRKNVSSQSQRDREKAKREGAIDRVSVRARGERVCE